MTFLRARLLFGYIVWKIRFVSINNLKFLKLRRIVHVSSLWLQIFSPLKVKNGKLKQTKQRQYRQLMNTAAAIFSKFTIKINKLHHRFCGRRITALTHFHFLHRISLHCRSPSTICTIFKHVCSVVFVAKAQLLFTQTCRAMGDEGKIKYDESLFV